MEQNVFLSNFILPLAVSIIVSVIASKLTYRNEAKNEERKEFPKLRVEAFNKDALKGKDIYRFSIKTPDPLTKPEEEEEQGLEKILKDEKIREPYFSCLKVKDKDVSESDVMMSFICYADGDFELKHIVKKQKIHDFKNTPLPVLDLLSQNVVMVISKEELPIQIDGLYRGVLRKYDIPSFTIDTYIQGKS